MILPASSSYCSPAGPGLLRWPPQPSRRPVTTDILRRCGPHCRTSSPWRGPVTGPAYLTAFVSSSHNPTIPAINYVHPTLIKPGSAGTSHSIFVFSCNTIKFLSTYSVRMCPPAMILWSLLVECAECPPRLVSAPRLAGSSASRPGPLNTAVVPPCPALSCTPPTLLSLLTAHHQHYLVY